MWSPSLTAISRAFLTANAAAQKSAADKTAPEGTSGANPAQSVSQSSGPSSQVSLSAAGLARAALAGSANSDIKQSGLPDSVQKVLTSVRLSQKGLQQMNDQLQAVISDKSLTAEMRQVKLSTLQSMSGIYQRQVSDSSRDLASAMNGLTSADKAKASMLVLAKM